LCELPNHKGPRLPQKRYTAASQTVFWREIAIPSGNNARNAAVPISQFDAGSGPQPLATYLNSGKPLATSITLFQPQVDGSRVIVKLESEGPIIGQAGNGRLQFTVVAYLRN